MGVTVVLVLALSALASASIRDNSLDGKDRVVSDELVLTPSRDATGRSRLFPILILLSQQNPETFLRLEPSGKSLEEGPIFVKTPEEQANEERSSRQKRSPTFKKFGKYGGGGGGYRPHGGGCNTCGGGGGGGQAVAIATANANSYGKK